MTCVWVKPNSVQGAALVATAAPLFLDDLGIFPRTLVGLVAWHWQCFKAAPAEKVNLDVCFF